MNKIPAPPIILMKPDEDAIFSFLAEEGRIVGDIMETIPSEDWHPESFTAKITAD